MQKPAQKMCNAVSPPVECKLSAPFTHKLLQVDSVLHEHRAQIRYYLDRYMALLKNDVSDMAAAGRSLARILSDKSSSTNFDMARQMAELFDSNHKSYLQTIGEINRNADLCPAELLAVGSVQATLNNKLGPVVISVSLLSSSLKRRSAPPETRVKQLSSLLDSLDAAMLSIKMATEFGLDPGLSNPVLRFEAPGQQV